MAKGPERTVDLAGSRVGRYEVVAEAQKRGYNRYYLCRCDCGNEREVAQSSLTQRTATSCGCTRSEQLRVNKPALTHGMSKTPEYSAWQNMRRRCYDKGYTEYFRYGARGIRVCSQWRDAFEQFFVDVGERPSPNYSLERRDNEGHYTPENCYWATKQEQANNRRNNTLVTLSGRTQTLAQWCRELGIKHHTVMTRIGKRGWTMEQALTTPTRKWVRK